MKTSEFLAIFPEFEAHPVERIEFFLAQAEAAISEGRFGRQTEYGRALFCAHHLVCLNNANKDGSSKTASVASGAVASKSVGGASISYDTGSASESDAGYWNATSYGRLLWGLMRTYRRLPFVALGRAVCP
jgi:hypothetical protein